MVVGFEMEAQKRPPLRAQQQALVWSSSMLPVSYVHGRHCATMPRNVETEKTVILYKRKKVVILKCFFCTTLAATNSHGACVHLLFDFHAAAQPRLPAVAAAKGSRWKLAVKHRLLWCKRTGAAEVSP